MHFRINNCTMCIVYIFFYFNELNSNSILCIRRVKVYYIFDVLTYFDYNILCNVIETIKYSVFFEIFIQKKNYHRRFSFIDRVTKHLNNNWSYHIGKHVIKKFLLFKLQYDSLAYRDGGMFVWIRYIKFEWVLWNGKNNSSISCNVNIILWIIWQWRWTKLFLHMPTKNRLNRNNSCCCVRPSSSFSGCVFFNNNPFYSVGCEVSSRYTTKESYDDDVTVGQSGIYWCDCVSININIRLLPVFDDAAAAADRFA